MRLTAATLAQAIGCTVERASVFVDFINVSCEHYGIVTPKRMAAYIAQIGHESGGLRHTVEIWGPTPVQARYEGRRDLGNVHPGDGSKFRGRGLIQLTGRFNHAAVRDRLRARGVACPDFEVEPEALAQPIWAAWSAADFWDWKKLNPLADADDFTRITRIINGGQNGREDRERRWARAKDVLIGNAAIKTIEPLPPVAPKEKEMLPAILAALAPTFVSKIPEIVGIATAATKDERKAKAVELAINVATEAVGATNAQQAAEIIERDPAAAERAREAVRANWFQIQEQAEKSIAAAREFAVSYASNKDLRTVLWGLTFLELLSLIMVVTSLAGGMAAMMWGDLSAEMKGAIITLILIGGYTGVKEFWFGSSSGSKAKDERADEVPR